MIDAVDHIK